VHAKAAGQPTGLPAHIDALFPSAFVDSPLGQIPQGWGVGKVGDVIKRLSVGKKYEQKTVNNQGLVPVLDQGKSGIIGFHNDEPGVIATAQMPVVVFANHTCYMRIVNFPFSTIQNVLPFVGKDLPTLWVYHATIDKQSFIEYKGHWPDFILHEIAIPQSNLAEAFSKIVSSYMMQIWENEQQSNTLTALRDTLLPKLLSGEVEV
jgi:type I restriction enzyme S subunit